MNAWKTAALAGALAAAAGIGAGDAPAVNAQSDTTYALATAEPFQAVRIWAGSGRLGMSVRDVNDDDVTRGRLGGSYGVVVDEVSDESAAQKAGFKSGDIVVEFDGERVRSAQQFTRLVQETPAGRSVSAAVMRDGQKSTVNVEPRDSWAGARGQFDNLFRSYDLPSRVTVPRPPAPPRAPTPRVAPFLESFSFRSGSTLGITVGDMSSQLAEYFGAKEGALVTSVTDNSAAAKAGIKAGDVITALNGEEVRTPSDVRRLAQRLTGGADFTVDVLRDKKKVTLKGKTETRQDRRRVIV
jgi:S1-C subfamily serine protease